MKKLSVILSLFFLLSVSGKAQQNTTPKSESMIRHTVAFKLMHPKGSPEELEFFKAAEKLPKIPSALNFEAFREVSTKNDFEYFFYMEFESEKDYEAYNVHPDHVEFVEKYWVKYVEKFIEIDYKALKESIIRETLSHTLSY